MVDYKTQICVAGHIVVKRLFMKPLLILRDVFFFNF